MRGVLAKPLLCVPRNRVWSFRKAIGVVCWQVVRTTNECELSGRVDQANKCLVKGERVFGTRVGRLRLRQSRSCLSGLPGTTLWWWGDL